MKFLTVFFIGVLFCVQTLTAQKTIHSYAYVVIPDQLSFQKTPGEYQLNELLKFLFKKEGMTTFFDNEKIPNELRMLDCGGLKMKVSKESSMLKIKTSFTLSDCSNEIVFTSEQGVSREKEYKKGYQESLRSAFKSFSEEEYIYAPLLVSTAAAFVPVSVPKKEITIASNKEIFTNEAKLSIELVVSKNGFIGNVLSSPTSDYSSGELICKFIKTSLPNVFKVQWKDANGDFRHTIGYFDERGNLKIDFPGVKEVTVRTFFK
tara:strand:- start:1619 stop:2404 length:786 start_codon:yes stop_codon:yes gene_type:complete